MSSFLNYNFSNKKVLVRVDFNVPMDANFKITDDTRMQAAIPTLKKIIVGGGSPIIMTHLGRPKNGPAPEFSTKHLLFKLISMLDGATVKFASDCIGAEAVKDAANLAPGEVLLLENVRFYTEEEKGDADFAKKLAALGDVYVNDAFGTAHRAHASTTVMAQYFDANNRMFGLLMDAEVSNATKVLKNAERPFTAILGGAKVSDKILIIENLFDAANNIIIGGGMAYTFLKAMGHNVGISLCEYDKVTLAASLLEKAKAKGVQLLIPVDSIVNEKFSNDGAIAVLDNTNIGDNQMGLDIGPKSIALFSEVIKNSKTILWNGPMGVFEMSNFEAGTKAIGLAVADATKNGAFSLVGGGDSVAAVNKYALGDNMSYVSTGGGAMLEFFEGKTLPGVAAI